MALITRALLALAVAGTAAATSDFNSNNSCKSSDFWWSKKSCCISRNTVHTPSVPSDTACPSSHWWKDDSKCCAPRTPTAPEAPSCDNVRIGGKKCGWSSQQQKCIRSNDDDDDDNSNTCRGATFYWGQKRICIEAPKNTPSPPDNTECPRTYFWHSGYNACAPNSPSSPAEPSCDDVQIKGKKCGWNRDQLKCVRDDDDDEPSETPTTPSGPNSCKNGEFWWSNKACCIPRGGLPSPPSPPSGSKCPPNWWWRDDCCVPKLPEHGSNNDCDRSWGWNSNKQCCKPSSPSAHAKRAHKVRNTACPTGLTACGISSLSSANQYECVDTKFDQESCGGCASTGEGENCTAIPNSLTVGCEAGVCKVYKCDVGAKISADGSSCMA